MSYEWFKDGALLGKSTSNKWTLRKMKAAEHDGTYSFKVTNPVGELTSPDFTVSILEPVKVTGNPEHGGIVNGTAGTLTVTATGGGTLSYQWIKYDSSTRKWLDIAGANSATLQIAAMASSDAGKYKCRVSNGASSYLSKEARISEILPPSIQKQPSDITANEGTKTLLAVESTATPLPTYQWQKLDADGVTWTDIPKATRNYLAFTRLYTKYAGKYRVVISNSGGSVTSDEAEVIVHYARFWLPNSRARS